MARESAFNYLRMYIYRIEEPGNLTTITACILYTVYFVHKPKAVKSVVPTNTTTREYQLVANCSVPVPVSLLLFCFVSIDETQDCELQFCVLRHVTPCTKAKSFKP